MDDPVAFLFYLLFSQQSQPLTTSIFESITFWIVLASIGGVLVRFIFVIIAIRSVQKGLTGGSGFQPGPLGLLGPLFGISAAIPKPQGVIEADRNHSYKMWGTILSFMCIGGGLFLFMIGATGNANIGLPLVTIENAAPGTVLFVVGLLIWRSTHK